MTEAAAHLPLQRAAAWLARPSPAARYGVKYGTAAAAALWLAYASGLPQPTWAVITVIFVCQPVSGGSIQKGLFRIAGTVVSAFVSIGLFGLFSQQPPLMLASLFAVWTVAVYGMTGPRYAYAWNVFGFTTGIILIDAMTGVDQIETLAFERASLVALGIVIVVVADAVFWPVGAEESLRRALAQRARQIQEALKQAVDGLIAAPDRAAAVPSPPSSPLTQELGLVAQLGMEIGASRARAEGFSLVALLLEGLESRVRLLGRTCEAQQGARTPTLDAALGELCGRLDAAAGEAVAALAGERAPTPFAEELERSLAAFETEHRAILEARLREPVGASDAADPGAVSKAHGTTSLSAQAAVLRDVVTLLRNLEDALSSLAAEDGSPEAGGRSESPASSIRGRFTVDQLRLERALRGSVAACASLLAMLALGWSLNSMVPIIAYTAASGPTRGAVVMAAVMVALAAIASWAISDLSIVFLFTHLDRMPLSLIYPFALAGGLGYLAVQLPRLGPLLPLVALLGILSVFGGDAPPQGVAGPYNTTVYLLLGVAAGLIAQRLLWPRTAAALFRERAATQLELCLRAFSGPEPGAETLGRPRLTAELVSGYARQLALLGPLHKQAHLEPAEQALDDGRRAALLVLTQDLFDAALRYPPVARSDSGAEPRDAESDLSSLRAALLHCDETLQSSMAATPRALRGDQPSELDSGLAEAHQAVETRLDELRGRRDLARAPGASETDAFLARLDARRRLVDCQLAIEAWLTEWCQSAAPERH